ncbi:hypothetical protein [Mesonia sp.]|uniref:ATP-grasp domain-containing protein n=1 Tax=Mesonia sp. TaxID=1960830 RepID=UPI00176B96F1|nr:hypothetical protein [Mesonia sp.]HIB38457.1 hypothetical protein [Mesonia sp.]
MKIAIHNSKQGFHPRWIDYCKENNIEYKLVDCYSNLVIDQLKGCSSLFWHYNHLNPKDMVIAKQILFALEHSGFKVFPNFKTAWHFDDKIGQKYLLKALNLPLVPSYVFFDQKSAFEWIRNTSFPKVFKLRKGAGSANVRLINNSKQAKKIIRHSFNKGFNLYNSWTELKERIYKYQNGKSSTSNLLKGFARCFYPPKFSKISGKEIGYVYFQEFIPNNDSDTRIIIIDNKAFALKRMVRKGDFRASGSGEFYYERSNFDLSCVRLAFEANKKIQSQCIAYDFIFDEDKKPLIVEISYGFSPSGYDKCPGYWDQNLQWYETSFNPYGWMINTLILGGESKNKI